MSTSKSREMVLRAAENVFAAKGFDGARMDEIAREARLNKAMIYYFFKSKEKLFEAVLEDMYRGLTETLRNAMHSTDEPEARLLAMVSAYFDFVDRRRTYPLIIQREMIGRGKFLRTIAQHLQPIYKMGKRVIQEGIRAGRFRKADPGQLLLSVVGLIAFFFSSAHLFGKVSGTDPLSPQKVALRKREIIALLAKGVLTKGGNDE